MNEFLEYPRNWANADIGATPSVFFTTAERVRSIVVSAGTAAADTLIVATSPAGDTYFRFDIAASATGTVIDVQFFASEGLQLRTVGGEEYNITVFWVDTGAGGNRSDDVV